MRQRRRQWKRRWEIDFASFKTFSPLYQVTQSLESREVKLELKRGDHVRIQREKAKFIALPFPFSSQLKIWSFHIAVGQGRQRNIQKAWCTCRVVVLLIKLFCFRRSRCRRRRCFVRSLLPLDNGQFFQQPMKKSRIVIKFDPYGALVINRGNRILIVIHLYCCSKHKLSRILVANVASLACFVTLTF